MKKFINLFFTLLLMLLLIPTNKPIYVTKQISFTQAESETTHAPNLLAIVIDDFGGYERTGVDELLESNIPITCAIMPFVDNTEADYQAAIEHNKEVILHMPMQAHVNLPTSWYGPVYIKNYDTPQDATEKLEKCLKCMPGAKGFNIHIGSGVSRNAELMKAMYDYSTKHDLMFLDSRTNTGDKCEEAATLAGSIYLGRDVFLEPNKNRSHAGVIHRLQEAENIAKEKGYAIAIGHVGAEGGVNTARAIIDYCNKIDPEKTQIVPLSTIYNKIKSEKFK